MIGYIAEGCRRLMDDIESFVEGISAPIIAYSKRQVHYKKTSSPSRNCKNCDYRTLKEQQRRDKKGNWTRKEYPYCNKLRTGVDDDSVCDLFKKGRKKSSSLDKFQKKSNRKEKQRGRRYI